MRRHFFALLVSVFCGDILSSSCGICTRWKSDGFCHTTYARMFCMETCHRCKRGRVTDSYFSSSWDRLIALNIVIIRNWLGNSAIQTSKEQTKIKRFMLEGPPSCTIFCSVLTPFGRVTKPSRFYWLVPRALIMTYCVLCRVMTKKANKNIEERILSSFLTIYPYLLCS